MYVCSKFHFQHYKGLHQRERATEANKISADMMQKVRVGNKEADSSFANDSSVC